MQVTTEKSVQTSTASPVLSGRQHVIRLVDGTELDISSFSYAQLEQLQCEQEPLFADRIAASQKDSLEREEITRVAYESICTVLHRMAELQADSGTFAMGMDPRYRRLVLKLLKSHHEAGGEGGFFELGFSGGSLLKAVSDEGYAVGGIEVAEQLLNDTKQLLPEKHHHRLMLGDFRRQDLSRHRDRYSVVYWNDVFEHIATDEVSDYLDLITELLHPGGQLVTITPNWHMRPSDVTSKFAPPRSEAVGFHMKEYRCAEVVELLRKAGFRSVHVPALVGFRNIYDFPALALTRTKMLAEPFLEWLPYCCAVQCCRRLGLNCTIAQK